MVCNNSILTGHTIERIYWVSEQAAVVIRGTYAAPGTPPGRVLLG